MFGDIPYMSYVIEPYTYLICPYMSHGIEKDSLGEASQRLSRVELPASQHIQARMQCRQDHSPPPLPLLRVD